MTSARSAGLQVLVGLEQPLRALRRAAGAQAGDVARRAQHGVSPRRRVSRAAQRAAGRGRADEHLGDRPVALRVLLDREVLDGGLEDLALGSRTVTSRSRSSAEHEGLVGALLEAAHVDQAGGDDLARRRRR